jgi:predicted glycosyltransferase
LKTIFPAAKPRILIYAMGGGFGHLTRAVALSHALGTAASVRIVSNSPYVSRVPELDLVPTLDVTEADCLVVDTFPRGLVGELVDVLAGFGGSKVLVARDLNPRYVEAYHVREFVERWYDVVLDAEATPWLVRSADEVLSRDGARSVLGLQGDEPGVLVTPAGNPEEQDWYREVAAELGVEPLSYWPAMELYAAADVVIGGAGYNTVNECVACGVPLVAKAWPRKYDRQELRARKASRVVREVAEAVAAAQELATWRSSIGRVIQFENGVIDAAQRVLAYCARA